MKKHGWATAAGAYLAGLTLLASCAAIPPAPPEKPAARLPSIPAVHSTAPGPAKGFTITQELTSMADLLWEGDFPDRGPISEKRETGLRILARFEVIERGPTTAAIRAVMEKTEILQGGNFTPAPFLQFSPPGSIVFRVNYRMRTVDFSAAERAFETWSESLRGTPAWEVMSANFSVKTYVAELKDIFGRTALDFAGNTYTFRRTVTEKKEFFVPLLGPGITLGPLDVDLDSSLRYVEVARGRKIFRITGEQHSRFLRMGATSMAARMRALGAEVPSTFESEGTLKGTIEAQVEADSGWTTEIYADFTAVVTSAFQGGALTETVKGYRIVVTR